MRTNSKEAGNLESIIHASFDEDGRSWKRQRKRGKEGEEEGERQEEGRRGSGSDHTDYEAQ